jgi:transcriptional regulator with XRE-family HTH domain
VLYKLKIKDIRIRRGLTQKELGLRVGISQNYLSEIENSKYDIGLTLLFKIGIVLEICPFLLAECKLNCPHNPK